jgi:hypothetical protein
MQKIQINLRNLGEQENYIKIPIGQNFLPIDTSEIAENQFIDDEIEKAINPIQDFEKMRFKPFSGITEVIVQLMETGSTPMTYDSFGYSNEDLKFQRNRFINSFLKLNFYDTPFITNRRLAFQLILFNQLNNDQRDTNGNLLDVSLSPITYRLVDPIKIRKGVSEGFYLYWLKTPYESYPNNFYMYATYNNAKNGISTQLIAYDAPLAINQLNDYNYTKYILSSIGNMQEYKADNTNRTITFSGNQMIIKLYKPDIV